MEKAFLTSVSQAANVAPEEVNGKTLDQVIEEIILPKILRPGGQDTRGWRIPDKYMSLMAEFGEYLHKNSSEGQYLLEIALQRLSCGAVLHAPTSYDVLPAKYKQYSVQYDQHGLMSDECWEFLTQQAKTCLSAEFTREHAAKIIFGLLDHLDEKGNTLGSYMFGGIGFKTPAKNAYDWAFQTVVENILFDELYDHLATPERWEKYKGWLKTNWSEIDKTDFYQRIGIGFFKRRKVKKEVMN